MQPRDEQTGTSGRGRRIRGLGVVGTGALGAGLAVVASPAAAMPVAGVVPPTPLPVTGVAPPASGGRAPTAMALSGVTVWRGRLSLRAELAPPATGSLGVTIRAHGRSATFQTKPIGDGHVLFVHRLRPALRHARTAKVTVSYPGDAAVRPLRTTVRAGTRAGWLRIGRAWLSPAGRLKVWGKVVPKARGTIRFALERGEDDGSPPVHLRTRIEDGRWSIDAQAGGPIWRSAQLSIRYPGDRARRIRGEQLTLPLTAAL